MQELNIGRDRKGGGEGSGPKVLNILIYDTS